MKRMLMVVALALAGLSMGCSSLKMTTPNGFTIEHSTRFANKSIKGLHGTVNTNGTFDVTLESVDTDEVAGLKAANDFMANTVGAAVSAALSGTTKLGAQARK